MIYEAEPTYQNITFHNPVCPSGADPWVIRDPDTGKYYYCYSGGNSVCVNEIADLAHITAEGGKKVYTAPENTLYSKEYWAPELHKLNGKWYIYVAADDGDNYHHRMYVLECTGETPTDSFKMVGKLTDESDKWAIDGTVAEIGGELYFVWSGWEGDEDGEQNLYIAHMASPVSIDSPRVKISTPTYKWEKRGMGVNEGPVALEKDGALYIVYSASGSWTDDYCLGMLRFAGGDVLNAKSWAKCPVAVFTGRETAWAPGHCSFVRVEGVDYIVYHANVDKGTGWNARSVRAQPIKWSGKTPVFGKPLPAGSEVELP